MNVSRAPSADSATKTDPYGGEEDAEMGTTGSVSGGEPKPSDSRSRSPSPTPEDIVRRCNKKIVLIKR